MNASCTFAVELTAGQMEPDRIEDIIYNCLDFCELNDLTPHFCVLSDAEPSALWQALELLHKEDLGFSLLTEPERSRGSEACFGLADIRIDRGGNAYYREKSIGNLLEDRLADLWVTAGLAQRRPC